MRIPQRKLCANIRLYCSMVLISINFLAGTTKKYEKSYKLNILSELFSCGGWIRAWMAGLRAIIWLLGGVRGGPACCHAEEGPGAGVSLLRGSLQARKLSFTSS